MKNTLFIKHDYHARHDRKIRRLIKKHGAAGYGIYWILIEQLYEGIDGDTAKLPLKDIDLVCDECHCDEKLILSVIKDFDLFQIEGDNVLCHAIDERIRERQNSIKNGYKGVTVKQELNASKQAKRQAKTGSIDSAGFRNEAGDKWIETTAKNLGIKADKIDAYFLAFLKDIDLKEPDEMKPLNEWRKHFINWLKLRIEKGTIKGKDDLKPSEEIPEKFTPMNFNS